jgi:hypothetical protein
MAEVRPVFFDTAEEGFAAEVADTDSIRAGGANMLGAITMNTNKITGMGDPTAPQDAATKAYVDAISAGLDPKESVRLATNAALPANTASGSGVGKTLTADANGALSVDGVAVAVGDRILVKDETAGADVDHGIYVVTQTGDGSNPFILTRADDFDTDAEVTQGARTFVAEGANNAGSAWLVITADPITVDTTAIQWTIVSDIGALIGGDGIDISGQTISVDLAAISGLEFNAGELRVDVANTDELSIDANGLNVEGVPSLFKINGVAVGATVTAANLDTLTNGSNADALHNHAGLGNEQVNADTGGVTKGDPIYPSGNDVVLPSDASTATAQKTIGIADTTAAAGNPTGVATEGDVLTGVLVGATAGDPVYLASGGGVTTTKPTGVGNRVLIVGRAKNATDIWVGPFYYQGRLAS